MTRPATARLKVNPAIGRPPVLEWIAPHELLVDDTYQRSLEAETSQTLIRRIAAFWDWGLCQPVNVARRADGSLWIVDGQHRRAAAMMRGDIAHLPCVIQSFPTRGDEAAAFVALNKQRRALSGVDVFKACLAAGDEEAAKIVALIEGAGLSIAPHQNYTAWKAGMLYCLPTIAAGYRRHGEATCRAALEALSGAFRNQVLQYAGNLTEGLILFLAAQDLDDFPLGRFTDMLSRSSQSEWVRLSRVRMASDGDGRKEAMRAVMAAAWGRTQAPPRSVAPPAQSDVIPHREDSRRWCDQCDRRVSDAFAALCQSRFCSLRNVA